MNLLELLQKYEAVDFPELEDNELIGGDSFFMGPRPTWFTPEAQKLKIEPKSYRPSWYVSGGLLNDDIVEEIVSGSTVLSVRAGRCRLEQMLVNRKNVSKDQFTFVDTDNFTPDGYTHVNMDVLEKWSDLDSSFDYVLFKESIGSLAMKKARGEVTITRVNNPKAKKTNENHRNKLYNCFADLINKSLSVLNPGGQVRIQDSYVLPSLLRLHPRGYDNMLKKIKDADVKIYTGHDIPELDFSRKNVKCLIVAGKNIWDK